MSMQKDYFDLRMRQFRQWDAEFDSLSERREQSGEAISFADQEKLKSMRAHRDAAYLRLQEVRTASESAWRGIQAVVDTAWYSARSALDQVTGRARTRR